MFVKLFGGLAVATSLIAAAVAGTSPSTEPTACCSNKAKAACCSEGCCKDCPDCKCDCAYCDDCKNGCECPNKA
jgi:hypothetical protein